MSQSKTFNTPFLLAIICIYLSYFLHGISVITLAQNMTSLAEKFSTDNAGIAYLISGIGLGRLVSILFFGVLSDKFGRRAYHSVRRYSLYTVLLRYSRQP